MRHSAKRSSYPEADVPRRTPLDVADGALGQLVERLTTSHHRRRLQRVGWTPAIDPTHGGWADGEPPPRPGNALEVLIDGADALRAMAAGIAEARSHVHLTGWHVTPEFALTRDATPTILRRTAGRGCLADPGSGAGLGGSAATRPPPLARPTCAKLREQLTAETRVHCVLDARERTTALPPREDDRDR